jgi:hypothetical protein
MGSIEGNRTAHPTWHRLRTTNANPPDIRGQSSRGARRNATFLRAVETSSFSSPRFRPGPLILVTHFLFLPLLSTKSITEGRLRWWISWKSARRFPKSDFARVRRCTSTNGAPMEQMIGSEWAVTYAEPASRPPTDGRIRRDTEDWTGQRPVSTNDDAPDGSEFVL